MLEFVHLEEAGMAFDAKVEDIRKRIKRYSTESLFEQLLKRLHSKTEHIAMGMPWVVCLTLGWVAEIEPQQTAIEATERDVQRILDSVWNLQSEASRIKETDNVWFTMRSFFIPQLRFQTNQIHHSYFLARLYTMMCTGQASASFKTNFKKEVGVELEDFFIFSLFLYCLFTNQNSAFIKYNEIVAKLNPAFSVEELKKMLCAVGLNYDQMKAFAKEKRGNKTVKRQEYFSEPIFLNYPVILLPEGVSTTHTCVATIGLSEFVIRTLKKVDPSGFRDKFTKEFENYLALVFQEAGYTVARENELKEHYRKHNKQGKVVDYIYQSQGTSIFIDAKGVEPRQDILTTDNPRVLKEKLRDLHLKGIEQAAACSKLLEQTEYKSLAAYQNRYALIVTHQDFYLGNGKQLVDYLGDEYCDKVEDPISGQIPVENVHFCSVADLEGILMLCNETRTDLHEFLDFCSEQDTKRDTAKFAMRQHMYAYGQVYKAENCSPIGSVQVKDNVEYLFNALEEKMRASQKHWHEGLDRAPEFLRKLSAFKSLV